ncbi:MAG: class I SAM-dependent methyltransferase [Actinobacteria bacterium]|nr:class I SAM-dependent methyltransferase [Actinomycetota bacterium]
MKPAIADWERKFAGADYEFGTAPNAFLVREAPRIAAGSDVLCIADGEGRNSTWLAEQGHRVHAVEASRNAIAKADALARSRGVKVRHEQVDLDEWSWPIASYDAVVAIFVQFSDPDGRRRIFPRMGASLRPGGVLIIEGYGLGQLAFATGGPKSAEYLYTVDEMQTAFPGLTLQTIAEYDAVLSEGTRHSGMSALLDLVAVAP